MIANAGLGSAGNPVLDLAIVAPLLILALLVLFLVALRVRKKYDPRVAGPPEKKPAVTMEQLEAWRDAGKIDDAEFSAMRRGILGMPPKVSPKEFDTEPTDEIPKDES